VSPGADRLHFELADTGAWHEIWPIIREVVSTGDTYPYPPELGETEASTFWMHTDTDREATFIARRDGVAVGTAYLKPNQVGLGDHVANAGWMIALSARGQGVGRRFGEFVMAEARRIGYHGMQFNAVVATNRAAIALWESLGFEIVGTVPDAFRHATRGLTPVHVMYRRL
jgi:RimJ/RimL family protein N-acetyltransferase